MKGYEITFVFEKATQRKFRYKQQLPAHENPVVEAECPYIYLDKKFVRQYLGDAQVITIVVKEGV